MYPYELIKKWWNRITTPVKIAFFSAMAVGLIVHMFMLTNTFPTHDVVFLFNDVRSLATQGRWFAYIAQLISSGYTMLPWVKGLIILLCCAFAACAAVRCLNIKNPLNCALIAGLMAAFPTVATTMNYYADVLFIALALAAAAVYVTWRFRFGFIAGVVLLVLSLATYQAHFAFAAALFVGVLISDILRSDAEFKAVLYKGAMYFLTLLIGMAIYIISVRLSDVPLTDYMGMNEMGSIPLGEIPRLIADAYSGILPPARSVIFSNSMERPSPINAATWEEYPSILKFSIVKS